MIYRRENLGQAEGGEVAPAPLTRDWSPWVIGGAIVLSGILALIATTRANRR